MTFGTLTKGPAARPMEMNVFRNGSSQTAGSSVHPDRDSAPKGRGGGKRGEGEGEGRHTTQSPTGGRTWTATLLSVGANEIAQGPVRQWGRASDLQSGVEQMAV